ncbi:MAG: SsrA-binding protein [Flavobacteriales bacterium]
MSVEIKNKKASYQYFLEDSFTAGILLKGSEIKSIRAGKASIQEAYCKIQGNELFMMNMYIAEYQNAGFFDHETRRVKKLLLSRTELNKIIKKSKDVGFTIVPTRLFINEKGWAKLDFALAKGKKLYDKREDIKSKEIKRDLDRLKKI